MDSEQKKTRLLPVLVVKEELVVGLIVDQQKHGRKPRKRGHRDFFSYEIDSLIAGAARQASDQKRKSILYTLWYGKRSDFHFFSRGERVFLG